MCICVVLNCSKTMDNCYYECEHDKCSNAKPNGMNEEIQKKRRRGRRKIEGDGRKKTGKNNSQCWKNVHWCVEDKIARIKK